MYEQWQHKKRGRWLWHLQELSMIQSIRYKNILLTCVSLSPWILQRIYQSLFRPIPVNTNDLYRVWTAFCANLREENNMISMLLWGDRYRKHPRRIIYKKKAEIFLCLIVCLFDLLVSYNNCMKYENSLSRHDAAILHPQTLSLYPIIGERSFTLTSRGDISIHPKIEGKLWFNFIRLYCLNFMSAVEFS